MNVGHRFLTRPHNPAATIQEHPHHGRDFQRIDVMRFGCGSPGRSCEDSGKANAPSWILGDEQRAGRRVLFRTDVRTRADECRACLPPDGATPESAHSSGPLPSSSSMLGPPARTATRLRDETQQTREPRSTRVTRSNLQRALEQVSAASGASEACYLVDETNVLRISLPGKWSLPRRGGTCSIRRISRTRSLTGGCGDG